MTELDDLVVAFGQIDEAVVADPSLTPKVAAWLPPYAQGASGWYKALQDFQRNPRNPQLADLGGLGSPPRAFLALSAAPVASNNEAWAHRHWLNDRRMLANTTLSRIHGSVDLPGGLHPRVLVEDIAADDDVGGHELHSHLRRAADYPNIRHWPKMMADVRERFLVNAKYKKATHVPPISWEPGSFRVVESQIRGTSVALRTHIHLEDRTLDQVSECLDPQNWQKYQPPWCEMNHISGPRSGIQRFRESISANCDPAVTKLTTVLDFRYKKMVINGIEGGILEYRIPDGPLVSGTDGFVTIDEGSLEIRPAIAPNVGVHFISTKRIQFEALRNMPTMTAAGLAFLVWVLGWDSLARQFVYFLADTETPTVVTPDDAATGPPGFPQGSPGDAGISTIINMGLSGWQRSVGKCVESITTSTQQAAAGNYGLTDYLSDLTNLSDDITNTTMAVASMGTQMWRAASESGHREDGSGNGSQSKQPDAPPARDGGAAEPADRTTQTPSAQGTGDETAEGAADETGDDEASDEGRGK